MILTAVPTLMKMRCQLSLLINGMTHLRAGLVLINWSKIYVPHLSQAIQGQEPYINHLPIPECTTGLATHPSIHSLIHSFIQEATHSFTQGILQSIYYVVGIAGTHLV